MLEVFKRWRYLDVDFFRCVGYYGDMPDAPKPVQG